MAAVFKNNECWDLAVHGERRRNVQRRKAAELSNIDLVDDRRLGLGRRWDDWRRPAAGSGRDETVTLRLVD